MPATKPNTIDDLGVRGCFCFAALLMAQDLRIQVMPTQRSTLVAMQSLRDFGVIDTPWPAASWPIEPRAEDTPKEQLQWRFAWEARAREGLLDALIEQLQSVPFDTIGLGLRLEIWDELAANEVEHYFESQLSMYNLDPFWAQDLVFAIRNSKMVLPIAKWRYCCWAATRFAAAQAQRHRFTHAPRLRENTYAELFRRAERLASGEWVGGSFVPFEAQPGSAGSRLFTQVLTGLGPAFWILPVSPDAFALAQPSR